MLPREIYCDCNAVVMAAVTKTFMKMSLNNYFSEAQKVLKNEETTLQSFLRLDEAHFMKLVLSWPVWKHIPQNASEFFVRVLSLFVHEYSYEQIKKMTFHFLVVALSKFQTPLFHDSLKILIEYIQSGKSNGLEIPSAQDLWPNKDEGQLNTFEFLFYQQFLNINFT